MSFSTTTLCQQQVRRLLRATPAQLQVKEESDQEYEVATEGVVVSSVYHRIWCFSLLVLNMESRCSAATAFLFSLPFSWPSTKKEISWWIVIISILHLQLQAKEKAPVKLIMVVSQQKLANGGIHSRSQLLLVSFRS